MKKIFIVFILFISILKIESKEIEIRWDYKIASKAKELIPLKMYWKYNTLFWGHKSNEKIVDLKNNLKTCSEEYYDDNLLCLGFLNLRQNQTLSVEIASKVLKRNIDEETILYPFGLFGDTNWSGEGYARQHSATILDPVWVWNFSNLIKIHNENKLRRATTFSKKLSNDKVNILRYFEHLKKHPRMTKDFAFYLKYLSDNTKLEKVISKNTGWISSFLKMTNTKEYSILLKSFIEKNNDRFININKKDREAFSEIFGYHIYAIPRIIQSFYRDLHYCYSRANETEKLINSLEEFVLNYSPDGWYKEFNKELAKAYIKRNNIGDKEKALEQYQIIGKSIYSFYKNRHKSYLLNYIYYPYEHNKKEFNEYVIRDWKKEIEEINGKIIKLGGELIDFEKQVTKLKKWYKEKEKTIAQEIKEDSFYQSLQRPLNEEEIKIKQQIENFVPENLEKAISENNLKELLKWSQNFTEKYAKPAIEKLSESEEGLKILKDTLSDNKWHRRIILNLIKKKGNIDLLKMAKESNNIKLKKEYYIYYLKSLPEIDALEYCLNRLKEYKKDEDIEPELFTIFLKCIGQYFKSTDISGIIRLIRNEKIIKLKAFYLKKLVNWNDIPNKYLELLNNILKTESIMEDKNKSEYILKCIGKLTCGSQKIVDFEEGKIIIKDFLNRRNSKFFKNYNIIIKHVKSILNKEENILDKADSIKKASIEELDVLKKIFNTTHNDDIKKYGSKGLYEWISNYRRKREGTYALFSSCLSKHNDIEIRKIAIFALAMNKDKYYIKNLEPLTKDENEEIKIMATDAIEYIKQDASK